MGACVRVAQPQIPCLHGQAIRVGFVERPSELPRRTKLAVGWSYRTLRMRQFQRKFCRRCGFEREFTKRTMNHLFHLAATVFTFGLWGIGWAALTYAERKRPWRCCTCGSRFVPANEPTSSD